MLVLYIAILVFLLIACLLTVIFRTMFRRAVTGGSEDADMPSDFSIEKYRLLDRLFDSADLRFLESQPGYEPSIGREFRRRRRAAAMLYLAELSADFNRFFQLAREIVAYSGEDQPGVVSALMGSWFSFHLRVFTLRLRLWLGPVGVALPRPSGLLEQLARMQGAAMVPVREA